MGNNCCTSRPIAPPFPHPPNHSTGLGDSKRASGKKKLKKKKENSTANHRYRSEAQIRDVPSHEECPSYLTPMGDYETSTGKGTSTKPNTQDGVSQTNSLSLPSITENNTTEEDVMSPAVPKGANSSENHARDIQESASSAEGGNGNNWEDADTKSVTSEASVQSAWSRNSFDRAWKPPRPLLSQGSVGSNLFRSANSMHRSSKKNLPNDDETDEKETGSERKQPPRPLQRPGSVGLLNLGDSRRRGARKSKTMDNSPHRANVSRRRKRISGRRGPSPASPGSEDSTTTTTTTTTTATSATTKDNRSDSKAGSGPSKAENSGNAKPKSVDEVDLHKWFTKQLSSASVSGVGADPSDADGRKADAGNGDPVIKIKDFEKTSMAYWMRFLKSSYHWGLYMHENNQRLEKLHYADKITKINSRGKKQDRILVITNKALYSLAQKDSLIKVRRRVDLRKIQRISRSWKSRQFVIHVPTEYDYLFEAIRRHDIMLTLQVVAPQAKIIESQQKSLRDIVQLKTGLEKVSQSASPCPKLQTLLKLPHSDDKTTTAIRNLVRAEQEFCTSVSSFLEIYAYVLDVYRNPNSIMKSIDKWNRVFDNYECIAKFHCSHLCPALQKVAEGKEGDISKEILNRLGLLKQVYETYIIRWDLGEKTVNKMLTKTKYASHFRRCEKLTAGECVCETP